MTEEQRSRRPIFIATLRAARLSAGCFVAHRSKTTAGILPLRFAHPAEIRGRRRYTSHGLGALRLKTTRSLQDFALCLVPNSEAKVGPQFENRQLGFGGVAGSSKSKLKTHELKHLARAKFSGALL